MVLGSVLIIGLYLAMVISIFVFQRHLMYYPVKAIAMPEIYGLHNVEEVFLPSKDGTKLQLWTHKARQGYPTVVYFHGNSYHLGDRANKFSAFIDSGFGLVAISYRGFGKSGGSPSESGIYDDARASVQYAIKQMHLKQDKLIYFGESLGTGVAVQMASEIKPGLLVLEAPYTSVETRSAELYPFVLGVRKLVLDKYNSLDKINMVTSPLLILHGELDTVIPVSHGRALFEAANEPKTMVVYPAVHHVDYSNEQITIPLIDAARKYKLLN